MKRFFGICMAGAIALSISACAGTKLETLEGMQPQGSEYDVALAQGYKGLSESEFNEGDYTSSDTFAERAKASAAGNPPAPESVGARSLPPENVSEMSAARDRLVAAQNKGAASIAPADTAEAQVMYDCWMQEQEENWPFQQDQISECREGYMAAMARVDAALAPGAPAPAPIAEGPFSFILFFDWDSDVLTPESQAIVEQAAANAKSNDTSRIVVTGHTDTSGSAEYNMGLSLRRAEAVREGLVVSGIPADKIDVVAKGQTEPLVATDDGVREPQNRRAQIDLSTASARVAPAITGGNRQSVAITMEPAVTTQTSPAVSENAETSADLRRDLAARGVPAEMIDIMLSDQAGTIQ